MTTKLHHWKRIRMCIQKIIQAKVMQILNFRNTNYKYLYHYSVCAEVNWNKMQYENSPASKDPEKICMKYLLGCKVIYFPAM